MFCFYAHIYIQTYSFPFSKHTQTPAYVYSQHIFTFAIIHNAHPRHCRIKSINLIHFIRNNNVNINNYVNFNLMQNMQLNDCDNVGHLKLPMMCFRPGAEMPRILAH